MKFNKLIASVLFLGATLSSFAQTKTEFDFKDFNSLDISGAITVEVTQKESFSIVLECPEDLIDRVKIELSGSELNISTKSYNSNKSQAIKVFISLPDLTELELSGASDLKLIGMNLDILKLEISGASSIYGDMDIKEIEIDASGASSIGLSGRANKASFYLSGASEFKGKGFLITDEFLADFSGASSATCQIDGDMFLKLSGASSISYHGEGIVLKEETSGASSIEKY